MFKKKYSKLIIMSAVILSFIISGTILLKSKKTYSLKQQYTLGNTSGNIINNGLTVYQNGYIYYSNISDRCKLYRMKEDGSDKKKISNDSSSYINVIGEWIYYRNDDDLGKIYKIKTDGTMRTCLNKDNSKFVTTAGDYIYYCNSSNNNQITRIKTDGSDSKVICKDSAEFINVSNGWIYYSNISKNNSMYKITTNGRRKTLISKDKCSFLNVLEDWIYYKNNSKSGKLCKIKINGQNNTVLDNTSAESINVCGDWIYYNSGNYECFNSNLCKIKADGTCKENICDGFSEKINISGDWIFCINDSDRTVLYKLKPDGTMKQNNNGIKVVKTTRDLNDVLLYNMPFEINNDKVKKTYKKAKIIVNELIKPEMTDLEKELVLHNYVVTHTKYDTENYFKNDIPSDDGSSYGILVNGIGVCAGYAEAMQLLLTLSNVECKLVNGLANGPHGSEWHAWNMVKIDGEYYQLDATWDDPIPDTGNSLSLNYFNIPDDRMEKNHSWEKSHYKACTSDRFSYLRGMDYLVYQDGWIYYSNISDGYRLYKMRVDGTTKEKLSDDSARYILVDGNYIYFSNYSKYGFLYRVDINGNDEKQLNKENCEIISIENGVLTYINANGCTKTMEIR